MAALGQAFFSMSLGLGCIMVYGSYIGGPIKLGRSVAVIAGIDTLIAIFAGLIIFSLVFQFAMEPEQGPGLVFKTLPLIFGQLPFGLGFSVLFFVLLALAALTSMLSLLEPSIAWLHEHTNIKRSTAAFLTSFVIWLLGLGTVFSFSDAELLTYAGRTFFGWLDHLTANIIMPVTGFMLAIFCAWVLPDHILKKEADTLSPAVYRSMCFLLRYVTPVVILLILIADALLP